jgi:iron complex transport system substrate-binding protein
VTLLPAATEIVAALGGSEHLVGISHECDYPKTIRGLPRVTSTAIDVHASGALIHEAVRELRTAGLPIIGIDAAQLRMLAPDLVITQSLCEVCAVADGQVHRLSSSIETPLRVLTLAGCDLEGIWSDIRKVGCALDLMHEADELVVALQKRMAQLGSKPARRRRVVCIEWLDPLYLAGHWVPDLVSAAGSEDVGAESGQHSRVSSWEEVSRLEPDLIIVMLCGFGVTRARTELEQLRIPEAVDLMHRVPTWIIDANSYTSRAGPRVVDGAELLHSAMAGVARPGLERWIPQDSSTHPMLCREGINDS